MQGIGSMLFYLGGGSQNNPDKYYGRRIKEAKFKGENNSFFLEFEDGTKISIYDDGQSCCESRYMVCEDDPATLEGKVLREIKVKEGTSKEGEYGDEHEIAFLEISTEDAVYVTFSFHNEHNGYYGGFGLTIVEG